MFACSSEDLVPGDVLVDLVVDLDGDGNVEMDAQPLTFRESSRAVSAGGSRGCSALASTLADQLHVAVAVKVHDQDHDQVNRDVALVVPVLPRIVYGHAYDPRPRN
jgi:hypothetical protein